MADAFNKLYAGVLTATSATLITAGTAAEVIIKHIRIVNVTANTRWFTFYHDTADAAGTIQYQTDVLAYGWAEFDGNIFLENSDTFRGYAEAAAALTCTIYGVTVT